MVGYRDRGGRYYCARVGWRLRGAVRCGAARCGAVRRGAVGGEKRGKEFYKRECIVAGRYLVERWLKGEGSTWGSCRGVNGTSTSEG